MLGNSLLESVNLGKLRNDITYRSTIHFNVYNTINRLFIYNSNDDDGRVPTKFKSKTLKLCGRRALEEFRPDVVFFLFGTNEVSNYDPSYPPTLDDINYLSWKATDLVTQVHQFASEFPDMLFYTFKTPARYDSKAKEEAVVIYNKKIVEEVVALGMARIKCIGFIPPAHFLQEAKLSINELFCSRSKERNGVVEELPRDFIHYKGVRVESMIHKFIVSQITKDMEDILTFLSKRTCLPYFMDGICLRRSSCKMLHSQRVFCGCILSTCRRLHSRASNMHSWNYVASSKYKRELKRLERKHQ